MDINLAILTGRLTRDPKNISKEGSDKPVVVLDIAVNGGEKIGGEWKETTEYIQATAFGATADNCLQRLAKGSEVVIVGRRGIKEWEYEGKTKRTTTVLISSIKFLGKSKPKSEEEAPF